jgi:uncharacterized protein YcgI (DUF1989 family)
MTGRIASEFIIPARYGRAFIVKRGQTLRIHQVEGGQVGDCVFINANDHRETFHVGQTWAINVFLGTGTGKHFKHFYSKPPRENVMLTTLADTYPNHWANMGGRCSKRLYQMRDGITEHRSCQENLAEALAPHGVTGDDIIDIFNVFMTVEMRPDGSFTILPTEVGAGDYIDLRAEMDVLAAVSACPSDRGAPNRGEPKPLGIKVFD